MTFLPIVERELRVASRARFTYWSRVGAAAALLLIFILLQLILQRAAGAGLSLGQVEFSVLKWLCFGVAGLAGIFLTSDSLSEERREGTLGLLFLTDLRGHDIVLGKLMAHSLRAFYGLLAAVPILGLTLLVGGVTGNEFWRAMLVIGNTLFVSLAMALLASSLSHDSTKAMNGALLLALLLFGITSLTDYSLAGWDSTKFEAHLSFINPGYLFYRTGAYWFKDYWLCLGLQHGLAWIFLALASLRAPRMWQEKAVSAGGRWSAMRRRWRYGGPRARAGRRKLLAGNPVTWLAARDRWLPRFVRALTVFVLIFRCSGLAIQYFDGNGDLTGWPRAVRELSGPLTALLAMGVAVWTAVQASRFFVEAMRNGALELILVTPVTPRAIMRGQWAALWRNFLFPVAAVVGLNVLGELVSIHELSKMISANSNTAANLSEYLNMIVNLVSSYLVLVVSLVAAGWVGMWLGLTNRKAPLAVLKTLATVFVLPYLIVVIGNVALNFMIGAHFILQNLIVTGFWVGMELVFIWWARRRLLTRLREMAAHAERPTRRWFRRSRGSRPPPVPARQAGGGFAA